MNERLQTLVDNIIHNTPEAPSEEEELTGGADPVYQLQLEVDGAGRIAAARTIAASLAIAASMGQTTPSETARLAAAIERLLS